MPKRKDRFDDSLNWRSGAPMVVQAKCINPTKPSWLVSNFEDVGPGICIQKPTAIPGFEALLSKQASQKKKLDVKWFPSSQNGTVLLHLKHPCSLVMCGHVCLNPLMGGVHVFGSNILQPTVIYSSKQHKTFTLDTFYGGQHSLDVLKQRLLSENILSSADLDALLFGLNGVHDVVLLVNAVPTPPLFHAKHYLKTPLHAVTQASFSLLPDLTKIAKCAIDVVGSEHYDSFYIPPIWLELQVEQFLKTVVIGGSSSGKSTLCKYLVNRLLNRVDAVIYIECDIGQGEFSPPGCVAAYLLTEPVLGPNFIHHRSSIKMLYLGEVDVTKCHSNYLTAVKYLINQVAKVYCSEIPWVVNTMGFCQGLGVHLNQSVIEAVQPTNVIQLKVADSKRNFKNELTAEHISNHVSLNYNFQLIDSTCSSKGRTNREARELKLLSHLSPVLCPPYFSFNAVQPFVISLSELFIGISANVAVDDVLRVLNGALVALCEAPRPGAHLLIATDQVTGDVLKIVSNPAVQPCIELGIVRGIDVDKKEVYLLTPLLLESLPNVKMLVVGNVEIPERVLTAQPGISPPVPYTASVTDSRVFTTVRRIYRPPCAVSSDGAVLSSSQ